MKFRSILIMFILVTLLSTAAAFAVDEKKEANFSAKEPVLLTSAGQSADAQMVKVLLERNKIAVKTIPLAEPGDLEGIKTLIIAVGGSSKGLGAAGIDAEKEIARVQRILNKAREAKIPVLAMHIGGATKRGELSDRFVSLVVPVSAFLLAVKEGDKDGFLTKSAAKGSVSAQFVDRISLLQEPLKTIFGK